MEDKKLLYNLIKQAKKGNKRATFEIIIRFDPLINKHSKINGEFNQECKDYIIDKLLKKIKDFKKIRLPF